MKQVTKNYDLCVAGGGFAGFGAAVRAARLGLKTLLVERSPEWGGAARSGMHQTLCGLYLSGAGFPRQTLNAGLSREIEQALILKGDAVITETGKVFVLEYAPESLQALFRELSERERNLDVLFETAVDEVQMKENLIKCLRVTHSGGSFSVECGAAIDCTGSGDLIRLSGASYEISPVEERQLAAYAFQIKNVRGGTGPLNLRAAYHLAEVARQGSLALPLRFSVWMPARDGESGVVKMSVPPSDSGYDLDEIRAQACRVYEILRNGLPEFRDSVMSHTAARVSEREGLRMRGLYTLSEKDVLAAESFEDGGVKSAWPIEFWDPRKGPRYEYLEDGRFYEIPDRCLRSKDIANLFAGGRCISADARAMASARMTGTCLALGERSADVAFQFLRGAGVNGNAVKDALPGAAIV